jgi:two-component system, response regulator
MTEPTILVIEDNDDDLELTLYALRKAGVTGIVRVARDGESGISMLNEIVSDEAQARSCLVLLDLQMPRIGGLRTLEAIRSRTETEFTPVVVLTSSAEPKDMVSSYRLRANSYVRKPVDLGEFVGAMKQILSYWTKVNLVPGQVQSLSMQ